MKAGEFIGSAKVSLRWREILALVDFGSTSTDRMALRGVRVEVSPEAEFEEHSPALLVASDGTRLAAYTTTAVFGGEKWPYGVPTSFTIPRPAIKRLKKPAKGEGEAWAEISFDAYQPHEAEAQEGPAADREEADSEEETEPTLMDEAEEETASGPIEAVLRNIRIRAAWDECEVVMRDMPQNFPKWRGLVPKGPFKAAKNVKLHAQKLATFSAAAAILCDNHDTTVALRRGALAAGEAEGEQVLLVQCARPQFFGLLMPSRAQLDDMQLPLWAKEPAP